MGAQLIHEQADLVIWISCPHFVQPFLELAHVHALVKDLPVLLALLLGDGAEQGQCRFVQPGLVHGHVLLGEAPLRVHHGLPGEARLVDVDDTAALIPGPGQLSFHRNICLSLFCFIMVLGYLKPFVFPFLYVVDLVDLPQQSSIHLGRRKLSLEMSTSIRQ